MSFIDRIRELFGRRGDVGYATAAGAAPVATTADDEPEAGADAGGWSGDSGGSDSGGGGDFGGGGGDGGGGGGS